ncbi:IS91 family transposase [Alkalimarinus coralli]|uniref:IS91 family transposase n=1 Tax=Alkalimarinus coralli TaxID=2935863 RepID=UPI00202AE3C2|nr:IS91 family transposase [Alkalimarinus coralli]
MLPIKMSDVLAQFGASYSKQYPLRPEQQQVVTCIKQCRTGVLGGVQLHCNHCGFERSHYYSCRNRHCPQCQQQASQAWRDQRQQDLLPVPYFHLVFTLPHSLNGWVRLHPREIYGLLFNAVWQTLKQFASDPKRLDGQLGMTAVLHTWGQQLDQHVHLHCLIPAGAWNQETQQWHPARSSYLFPVKALSRGYRGRMVSLLRQAYGNGELEGITRKGEVDKLLNELMGKNWVVYTKTCHGNPERVLDYLARYTHRIAISESRLLELKEESVRFRWKDYRDGQHKIMQLAGIEFLRRFLQHVLPKAFMRIRHYGFLSNRYRKIKLEAIRKKLMNTNSRDATTRSAMDTEENDIKVKSASVWYCSRCKSIDTRILPWIALLKERPRMI